MARLPGRLGQLSRWRQVGAALGAIAVVALAIGVIVGAGLPGTSKGASSGSKGRGTTTVQRRDLVATDTEAGTLSYASPHTVFNRLSGTITSLPTVGEQIKPGQTLYRVDGAPVVLFNGSTPAYRDLSAAVTDGPDVQQLKQNLVALGFDPSHQITINQTFDSATTTAVEAWQASLGQSQTGVVKLGQVVFLPGDQRITAIDTTLGSTGGSGGSGSGGSGSGGSGSGGSGSGGSGSGASTSAAVHSSTEFVSFTTSSAAAGTPAPPHANATRADASRCPSRTTTGTATTPSTTTTTPTRTCPPSSKKRPGQSSSPSAQQLLAELVAQLRKLASSSGGGSRSSGGAAGSAASARGAGGGSGSGGSSGGSGAGAAASGASSGTGTAAAQPILSTTSTQLIVSVQLDATKQSEATVGEPVTVQLPDGSTVDGKISQVSPVAQSSSSSSSSGGAGGGGSNSTPSATIPVTITLSRHARVAGLDQAAVSVNFEQQVERNVLSVPVTALLATAGGGYAVQEANPPHRLIPVTPGLFAAGFVQVSGNQIADGLQVTDSQG